MSSNITIQRICQHCGKEFTARTTVTQYCGDACAKRAYKARQKAAKVETSNRQTKAIKEKPMEDLKAKAFLSVADTCQLLGISRWTLWRLIKRGELPAAKFGRSILIKRADIDSLFQLTPLEFPAESLDQDTFNPEDCYSLSEVQALYRISEKALHELIKRIGIPKYKQGIYAYVPKAHIRSLLGPQSDKETKTREL
ncbi:helix-turn-helix domain-containing protein [Pontibacter saemangeumensis]|uniref:Helix-turn-helix domain-containing protein n=1 Tax=Pontibacter saemangeumensis TaxID=1084525 RepID=A0ABP8MB48_9BACT